MSNQFIRAFVLKRYSSQQRRIHWPYFIALLVTSFASAVMAQPHVSSEPLSLEKALHLAEHHSQALLAQDASAQASRELAIEAAQLPDPELQLSIDNVPANGSMAYSLTEDFMTMRIICLYQTFTGKDKRRARANVFEQEVGKAQIAKALTLVELRQKTAAAWFDAYYLQQMLALLRRQKEEATLQVKAAEAAYRGGKGPQSDIFLARTAVAEIQDRMHQTQARFDNAITTLARWVGETDNLRLVSAPDISQTKLDTQHLAHEISEHPDIAVMMAEEVVAKAKAKAARQEKQADWTWSLRYSERGSDFSDMISLGVSIPLQWNQENRQDRVVAAKLAKAEQIRAEREEMTRQHLAETERWLTSWQSNLLRLADYEKALVPLASQRTEAALAEYRGGVGELVAVLDARKMEIATRIEQLRIEMETAALWAALEYLTLPDRSQRHIEAGLMPSSQLLEFKE
jgi:outer membrane protein TolC